MGHINDTYGTGKGGRGGHGWQITAELGPLPRRRVHPVLILDPLARSLPPNVFPAYPAKTI